LAWGTLAGNTALWQSQGAAYLAQTASTAPVLFFYNTDDASYYQDQIAQFKNKLDALGVSTPTVINYGTGHAVPQTSAPLATVYNFFNQYLTPPSVTTGTDNPVQGIDIPLALSPDPATDKVELTFKLTVAGNAQIVLCNLSGIVLYKTEKCYGNAGQQNETLYLNSLNLPQGIYFVKVVTDGMQGVKKLLKK
jgi:hypothetical protein